MECATVPVAPLSVYVTEKDRLMDVSPVVLADGWDDNDVEGVRDGVLVADGVAPATRVNIKTASQDAHTTLPHRSMPSISPVLNPCVQPPNVSQRKSKNQQRTIIACTRLFHTTRQ